MPHTLQGQITSRNCNLLCELSPPLSFRRDTDKLASLAQEPQWFSTRKAQNLSNIVSNWKYLFTYLLIF